MQVPVGFGDSHRRSSFKSVGAIGPSQQARAGSRLHSQAAQAAFEQSFGAKRSAELRALMSDVVASALA
jgi:hypothetical protein